MMQTSPESGLSAEIRANLFPGGSCGTAGTRVCLAVIAHTPWPGTSMTAPTVPWEQSTGGKPRRHDATFFHKAPCDSRVHNELDDVPRREEPVVSTNREDCPFS